MTTTNDTITVITASCLFCGKRGSMTVPLNQYGRWQDGEDIWVAFPDLSAGELEMLEIGIHVECPKEEER